jgi:hypothetical protein
MNSSLVYSNTAVTSADGEVSINHHTDGIYIMNLDGSTNATVLLNGKYNILIHHSHNQSATYTFIPGDYTKFQVITAAVTLSVYAVG